METEKPVDLARLEELAAVTAEYVRYSDSGVGLAATGTWVLAAVWVATRSARVGELLLVFAPLASMAFISSARAYYQRHGKVIGSPPEGYGLARSFGLAVVFVSVLAGIDSQFIGPRRGDETLAVAALLGTAMLASRFARTYPSLFLVLTPLIAISANDHEKIAPPEDGFWFRGWVLIALGLAFTLAGAFAHYRYRRVERRLAAIRGKAA
jgi:hypothetical protein